MLMKAQAFFVPFPKAGDKYWQKQVPVVQKTGRILLQGGMVSLEYDAQYLSASVEKVQMTDGIMKTQWKDNIYRIILRLNDNYPMAKVKYRFVGTRYSLCPTLLLVFFSRKKFFREKKSQSLILWLRI